MATTPDWGAAVTPVQSALLVAYRAELLRWNRQINLLSRRDPEGTATALIRQCVDAFARWWGASGAVLVGEAAGARLRLFDLGSGGGLPAFVWLTLLAGRGVAVQATLVEPRQKRAWFLERLRELPGAPEYEVIAAPWGPGVAGAGGGGGAGGREGAGVVAGGDAHAGPGMVEAADRLAAATPILFTLKALRLTEATILTPLPAALGAVASAAGRTVEVVRFQPGVDVDAAALAAELAVPAAGTVATFGGAAFSAEGCALLAPEGAGGASDDDAGLLVSRHRMSG